MKKKLRGIKRQAIRLDFNLYRVRVPIPGQPEHALSVIDMWPEEVEDTIVFVHGYAGCAETWEYQINHFAREFRVVVPDLRGHGQSDAPYTRYTMDELVADLHAIANTLHLPDKFILAGHSFGGSVCIEYANTHPERLEKLILVATAAEYPMPRGARLVYRIPSWFYRLWWDYRPRWNAAIHVLKRMMFNNMRVWSGWPLLRNITTPTLVITGERDTYFPREVFEEVAQMIPGAEVYDVGSAKHSVQLERHRAVNRAISRFVKGNRSSWRDQSTREALIQRRPWLLNYHEDTPYTIPIPRQPLHKFLESAADWVPKRTALIFYGARLSYRELNAQVNQLAHALRRLGLARGDRVMLVLPNVPQLVIAYYAVLKAGGVVVLANPDADNHAIAAQMQATGATMLVTLSAFNELVQTVTAQVSLDAIVLADMRHYISSGVYKKLLARWASTGRGQQDDLRTLQAGHIIHHLVRSEPVDEPEIEVAGHDLAIITYTSGTAEEPKGVALSHSNVVANTLQTRHWLPDLEYGREKFLSVTPLLHSYGMTSAMNVPVALGSTMILLPVFDLELALNHIRTYEPTIFPGVPSMYTAINHAPNVRSYGLASIKACISGGAPLPIEVQEEFEKMTRGRLVEGYGLTEAAPVTHANPLYGVRKVGSIGVPLPNTDAKIIDLATGNDLPPGEIGELVVKGPQVMQGYWVQAGAAPDAHVIDAASAIKDGWLYTGDVALMDADGYFQIIGRRREAIRVGEHSVYPRDVEEVLYENPKVLEAAVVGDTSPTGAPQVKAFVVPRPGTRLSARELLELCRRRLDAHAVPQAITFCAELPKSFVGKVIRRMLVDDTQEET